MKTIFLLFLTLYATTVFAQFDAEKQIFKTDSLKQSLRLQTDINYYFFHRDSIFQSNIGKQYPDFRAIDLNDEIITEKYLLGKITLINFWFEGCTPCVAEFDDLSKLHQKYKNHPEIQIISITKDIAEDAKKAREKYKIPYTICPVSLDECYRLNQNGGFPTNIITDKTGKIVYLTSGGKTDKKDVEEQVKLLEKKIIEALSLKKFAIY